MHLRLCMICGHVGCCDSSKNRHATKHFHSSHHAIMRSLDWLDPLAARIGACNTVAVQRGKWLGWNTDAAAVVEVLSKRLRLAGSRILILGAGGAARAAAYTVRAEGAVVLIAARRESAAQALARGISAQVVPWESTEIIDVEECQPDLV